MSDRIQDVVDGCVAICSKFRCSIEAALDDLSWPTNGLGLTEEEEFLVRHKVKIELRKIRNWERQAW